MRFEVQKNLTFAFTDSFSQSGADLNDDVQQGYCINETEKLWNKATGRNESFDFKTIEVLEENLECKEKKDRLHDIMG